MPSKFKKAKDHVGYKYLLDRLFVRRFSFEPLTNPSIRNNFQIDYSVSPHITTNKELDSVLIKLVVEGVLMGTADRVILLESVLVFKLKDLKAIVKIENGISVFPENFHPLLVTFISISISTTRGILHEKLKGTVYQNKFLPIVDPNTFFKKIDESTTV